MLIERDTELNAMTTALRIAQRGAGSLVVIRGSLGSGKSELLRALPGLARPLAIRVLRANGSPLERDHAFGVVRQLLDPVLFGATGDMRDHWLGGEAGPARAVFADDAVDDVGTRTVAVEQSALPGLQAMVKRMSAEQTLIILVDDLQWCDESSLRWLGYLATRLNRLCVLLAVTVRDGDPHSGIPLVTDITGVAARTLRPRQLSPAGTRDFVAEETGGTGDEEFVLACHETTGGNPLFLKSVLFNLSIQGIPPRAEHANMVCSQRPARLRERLISCLRPQPERVRTCAGAIAVLGNQPDLDVPDLDVPDLDAIAQLAGLDVIGCAEAVRTLHQLGLVVGERQPTFSHLVVRDAVEESTTAEDWEKHQIRAVRLLHDRGAPAERVAARLLAITSSQGDWVIDVLRSASDTALRRGAPEVASRYLRRALFEASSDEEDRAWLLVDLATAERGVDAQASVRHISYAVPLLRAPRDRAVAVARIAPAVLCDAAPATRRMIRDVHGQLGDLAELTGADRDLKLRLEARMRHVGHTDPAELADTARRLEGLGHEPAVDTAAERELLIVLLHGAMLTLRKPAREVARLGERILEREPASPSHVHTALPMLVTTLAVAESVTVLVPWLEMALDQARRQGDVVMQALIRTEQAVVALRTGWIAEAKRAAREAFELVALDWKKANFTAAVALAAVAMAARDHWLVEHLLAGYREVSENACLASMFRMLQGSAAVEVGDLPAALEHFLECGRQLDRSNWRNSTLCPWRSAAVEVYRRLGDIRAARELAEEDRVWAAEWGAPAGLGRAQRVLASLVDGQQGVTMLREAVATLEGSANKLELARALWWLGTRLRQSGGAEAAAHLSRSRWLALECGDERRAGQAAMGTVEVVPGRSPAPRFVLTKAEDRVVLMAVSGQSNREIAERLGVSLRAVEKHLTNSYRKLGIRGRSELVGVLWSVGGGS